MEIRIINKNWKDCRDRGESIMRGTPLGNPHTIKDFGREGAILKYREWIWEKIQSKDEAVCSELRRLFKMWKKNGTLELRCACSPKPCHGQIVRSVLLWADEIAGQKNGQKGK